MAVRQLEGWTWAHVQARLSSFQGPVVFAWVALVDPRANGLTPLGASIRCGHSAESRDHTYQRLAFHRQTIDGSRAAWIVANGAWPMTTPLQAPVPPSDGGGAHRVTGGDSYGPLAPIRPAHVYYTWTWPRQDSFSEAIFDEPLQSATEPWYPSALDAINELLYGRTRSPYRFDWGSRLVVDLPYGRAHLDGSDFVPNQGLVVNVGESTVGGAAGHDLHAVWQLHPSSSELRRWKARLVGPGTHTIEIEGDPTYWSVALLDASGELVDSHEHSYRRPTIDTALPLPALAIAEALDSLDSVWRLVFGIPLFQRAQLTSVADTSLPAEGREDLITRLSSLANLLDAARIDDGLLRSSDRGAQGTLNRIKLALGEKLTDPDKTAAQDAVDELRAVVQLRVAFQHKTGATPRQPDLEGALGRLNINFPPDPSAAWESIRRTVVAAAAVIRRALRATLV